jgi:hypothetical protein
MVGGPGFEPGSTEVRTPLSLHRFQGSSQSDFRMRFGFSSERFLIRSRSYVHNRRWLRARG